MQFFCLTLSLLKKKLEFVSWLNCLIRMWKAFWWQMHLSKKNQLHFQLVWRYTANDVWIAFVHIGSVANQQSLLPFSKFWTFSLPGVHTENEPMMKEVLGLSAVAFKPSIPKLVYQYLFYVNYTPTVLCQVNPEIPEDWHFGTQPYNVSLGIYVSTLLPKIFNTPKKEELFQLEYCFLLQG